MADTMSLKTYAHDNSIHSLCYHGNLEALQSTIDSMKPHINLEETDNDDYSPLKLACMKGHLAIVELLLVHGVKVNRSVSEDDGDVLRSTPLYFAAEGGHLEIARVLLKHGGEIDAVCRNGETPLYTAADNGHLEVVKLLVEHNAQIDLASFYNGSPIMGASYNGHVNVVKYLLEHGANPQSEGDGSTPLCLAAREGHIEVVRLLLEYSAGTDVTSYMGINALCTAVANGYLEMAVLLIENGAQVDQAMTYNYLGLALKDNSAVRGLKWDFMSALHYRILQKFFPPHEDTDAVWLFALAGVPMDIKFKERKRPAKTVWEMCGDDKELHRALLHFWSPQDHRRHPKCVRNAIVSTLLIAKKQQWPLDNEIKFKIFQFIAYGWWMEYTPREIQPTSEPPTKYIRVE